MRYLFFFFVVCFSFRVQAEMLFIEDKVKYDVHIPKTEKEKQKGLMFVKHLPCDKGMLFDLRENVNSAMWMKNTYIPLDMLFIDCAHRVVDIYENTKPLSLELISSPYPYCYVLEINGGQVQKHKIKKGDFVQF